MVQKLSIMQTITSIYPQILSRFLCLTEIQLLSYRIFNRWGGLVHNRIAFQPNDPTYGWDGFFNGKALDTDVFVYYVEVEYTDGVIEVKKGDVMLVR